MDVIAPQLLWIQGRCYRVNPSIDSAEINEKNSAADGSNFTSCQV